MKIRDRIKDFRRVKASELAPSPKNWRTHPKAQRDALQGVLAEIGFAGAVLARETPAGLMLIDGHLRVETAADSEIPVLILDVDEVEADKILATFDPISAMAGADAAALDALLRNVQTGSEAVAGMLADLAKEAGLYQQAEVVEDEAPEPPADPITKAGDLWILGNHRVLCGDSTKPEDVARLMNGAKAQMIHADPPYGMGKEKDGVQNDNLYADKLDAFQMAWWRAFRPHAEDNASAYLWGNAEGLWRLWYCGGLADSERLTLRNEFVWSKGQGQGMQSEQHRMFPTATERCIFFMLGEQGFNNNADNYWEGWELIRNYLADERNGLGWNNKIVANFFGFHPRMADHWFSQSQWSFITEEQYKRLQAEAKGNGFKREYDELKREFYSTRAYFDNTHDNMTDVWEYPGVTGEDRLGHATPKPVAMIERCIKSSSEADGIVIEPFLGSGTTLIAAEKTNRKCYGMEISPKYCDVIIQRWENATGKKAVLDGTTNQV